MLILDCQERNYVKKQEKMHMTRHKHSKKQNTTLTLREPVISEKLTKKMELTEDILLRVPIVTGYGNQRFCIENYRNIIEYTTNLIRVQTKTGKIHILGRNLVIAYFRDDVMCVMGEVLSIEYH